jgi:hypothetical protein
MDCAGIATTTEWCAVKQICHMALEELLQHIICGSMMDNSKKEQLMDL